MRITLICHFLDFCEVEELRMAIVFWGQKEKILKKHCSFYCIYNEYLKLGKMIFRIGC